MSDITLKLEGQEQLEDTKYFIVDIKRAAGINTPVDVFSDGFFLRVDLCQIKLIPPCCQSSGGFVIRRGNLPAAACSVF